jgi:hypothetical protein
MTRSRGAQHQENRRKTPVVAPGQQSKTFVQPPQWF